MPTPSSPLIRTRWHSPVGELLLVCDAEALRGLWFVDQPGIPPWAGRATPGSHPLLERAVAQLTAYFAGERRGFDLPLNLRTGTPFQQAVWQALQAIPWGHTATYLSVATAIGRPSAVRAVGGAIGRNPIGIIVPCHRVVGSDGRLTGYTGGLERKCALLSLEASRH